MEHFLRTLKCVDSTQPKLYRTGCVPGRAICRWPLLTSCLPLPALRPVQQPWQNAPCLPSAHTAWFTAGHSDTGIRLVHVQMHDRPGTAELEALPGPVQKEEYNRRNNDQEVTLAAPCGPNFSTSRLARVLLGHVTSDLGL